MLPRKHLGVTRSGPSRRTRGPLVVTRRPTSERPLGAHATGTVRSRSVTPTAAGTYASLSGFVERAGVGSQLDFVDHYRRHRDRVAGRCGLVPGEAARSPSGFRRAGLAMRAVSSSTFVSRSSLTARSTFSAPDASLGLGVGMERSSSVSGPGRCAASPGHSFSVTVGISQASPSRHSTNWSNEAC